MLRGRIGILLGGLLFTRNGGMRIRDMLELSGVETLNIKHLGPVAWVGDSLEKRTCFPRFRTGISGSRQGPDALDALTDV